MPTHPKGGSRRPSGRTKKIAVLEPGPRPRKGPNTNMRKTDITMAPVVIDATKRAAKKSGISYFEWQRLAVAAYVKELHHNPIPPPPTHCSACMRPFRATREFGRYKRLRVSVLFDRDTVAMMEWIANTFHNGTWSHAFEAACRFYLGPDAPLPGEQEGDRADD